MKEEKYPHTYTHRVLYLLLYPSSPFLSLSSFLSPPFSFLCDSPPCYKLQWYRPLARPFRLEKGAPSASARRRLWIHINTFTDVSPCVLTACLRRSHLTNQRVREKDREGKHHPIMPASRLHPSFISL